MVADGEKETLTGGADDFRSIDVADDVTVVTVWGGRSCRVDVADDELSWEDRTLEKKVQSKRGTKSLNLLETIQKFFH